MTETFLDMFCGCGGSTKGLKWAGFDPLGALNHWQRAIQSHSANFPDVEHLCANVNDIDMRRIPHTTLLWASPICTEASPAGGRRARRVAPGQADLLAELEQHGPIAKEGMERTRATFHDVIRATEVHRYKAVMIENVPAVATTWELFDWWVQGMCLLGYTVQYTSVSSAHVAGTGALPAPQWRDRLYMVFTRKGIRLPDVEPRPLAWCAHCDQDVQAIQSWRKPGARHIGCYRQQYDYRCPNSACRHALVEPYVMAAATAISWDELGERIGDRARPLAPATMRRIEAGIHRFMNPDQTNDDLPVPLLVPCGGTWNDDASSVYTPARTRTAREMEGLLVPRPTVEALRRQADTQAMHALLAEAAHGRHPALVLPYYRTGVAKPIHTPLDTVTTVDRFGLLAGNLVAVEDCTYRMLSPRESLRTQGFPDDYIVHGNRAEQTMQAGNAVSVNAAHWLGERVAAVLG